MLYYLTSFLTGAIISIMVVCNTQLCVISTNEVSTLFNQLSSFILLCFLMLIFKNNKSLCPERKESKWYMWFGGLFGLYILTVNSYAVINVGTTLAMASAVFGQSLIGLILDITGWFGVKRRKITPSKWFSLSISFLGILYMSIFSGGSFKLLYILLGISSGVITMLQMVYNSSFASKKGPLFSARQNALSGFLGMLIIAYIFMPGATNEGIKNAITLAPWMLLPIGGICGTLIVVSTNIVIPKIPTVYSALLLSAGQILTSLLLDKIIYNSFTSSLLIGSLIMLLGMYINFLSDKKLKE